MMPEQHYEVHKTSKIVWNSPKVSCITFPQRIVGKRASLMYHHVSNPLKSLRRRVSALSDTLIIVNISFNLLKPLESVFCVKLCGLRVSE